MKLLLLETETFLAQLVCFLQQKTYMYEHFKQFSCTTYVRWAHALNKLATIGMLFHLFWTNTHS